MEEGQKLFFSLQEVMAETGLPASTLYYWERQFPKIQPRRDGHKNRYYHPEDVAVIKQIQYVRDELKITRIEAIRREMDKTGGKTEQKQQTAELLMKIKKELLDIRSQL